MFVNYYIFYNLQLHY
jgi:hypothetical protein